MCMCVYVHVRMCACVCVCVCVCACVSVCVHHMMLPTGHDVNLFSTTCASIAVSSYPMPSLFDRVLFFSSSSSFDGLTVEKINTGGYGVVFFFFCLLLSRRFTFTTRAITTTIRAAIGTRIWTTLCWPWRAWLSLVFGCFCCVWLHWSVDLCVCVCAFEQREREREGRL
jgi:hypothetical protein